jgi:hypothetical protein
MSKLVDAAAVVVELSMEAQKLMSDEVMAHEQVSLLYTALSLSSSRESYFQLNGAVISFFSRRS